jgi:mannose-6-phosphate isomerase-like protein (cupin superfamily)
MKVSGKIWGKTQEIIKGSTFELHRIVIEKGGFCSLHKHEHKNNAFFVESGSIEIDVHKNDYDLIDKTYLNTGDMLVVKTGEYHKFKAVEDSIVYEIYWIDDISEDIIRKEVGGKK